MNILITSASRKVSLVRAFQQALGPDNGKVIAVDTNPLAPALYLADDHYLVPPSHTPEFLKVMLDLCKVMSIRLLVPTRDEELPFFAEHKDEFAYVGTTVMVPDLATVNVCQDKSLFIKFCGENGFATPTTYHHPNSTNDMSFPVFLKPRYGKGGRGAARVNSKEELALILEAMPDAIVQEFVQAPEYTVDLFADFSGRVISVVPRERLHVVAGESFVARTSRNPALIQGATQLAVKLGLVGHNTIQCFLEDNVVKFIEVNPRFGGAAHLGFAAGAPTPAFLVDSLKGVAIEPKILAFKGDYVMLRYTEDLFLDATALTNRKFP